MYEYIYVHIYIYIYIYVSGRRLPQTAGGGLPWRCPSSSCFSSRGLRAGARGAASSVCEIAFLGAKMPLWACDLIWSHITRISKWHYEHRLTVGTSLQHATNRDPCHQVIGTSRLFRFEATVWRNVSNTFSDSISLIREPPRGDVCCDRFASRESVNSGVRPEPIPCFEGFEHPPPTRDRPNDFPVTLTARILTSGVVTGPSGGRGGRSNQNTGRCRPRPVFKNVPMKNLWAMHAVRICVTKNPGSRDERPSYRTHADFTARRVRA